MSCKSLDHLYYAHTKKRYPFLVVTFSYWGIALPQDTYLPFIGVRACPRYCGLLGFNHSGYRDRLYLITWRRADL